MALRNLAQDQLDILVHSIAFAPKDDLQVGPPDCSAKGFRRVMDLSIAA